MKKTGVTLHSLPISSLAAVVTPMDKMHPFFGNVRDPKDTAVSSDPRERFLINQVLARLDPDLNAIENHDLVLRLIAFKSATHTSQRSAALLATVFERLLNWAFFVRRISLLKMRSEDITKFYDFYLATPADYLRTVRNSKRFISSKISCSVNPDWRPFYLPQPQQRCVEGIVSVASALREFYKYARQYAPAKISVPRYRLAAASTAQEETSSDGALLDRYFECLIGNSNFSIRRRFGRASRHKQIFLFATCYLLKVPFAMLSKCTRYFSMSSFSETPQGWYLRLSNDEEVVFRGLPDGYVNILLEFRACCGLNGMPGPNEIEPIFESRAAIKNVFKSLPVFDFMSEAIGQCLRRFISDANKSAPAVLLVSVLPHVTAHDRRKKKSLGVAAGIFATREPLCSLGRPHNPPPPLFTYLRNSAQLLELVDLKVLLDRVRQHLTVLSYSDVSTIIIFVRYANGDYGKVNRYKVRAFEKLVLWCVFIKGTHVADLTENEVLDFFHFCSSPPLHWCFTSPAAVGADRSSAGWRPFNFLLTEDSLRLRGVRIVEWCSSVFQDLVDMSIVNFNPFNELSNLLLSPKRH